MTANNCQGRNPSVTIIEMGKRLTVILFFITSLVTAFILLNVQYTSLAGLASYSKPADLIIDIAAGKDPVNPSWANFSQGGEEPPPMLHNVSGLLKELSPQYIRLDHIFDYYSVVNEKDGKTYYDFSKLDETVNDILKSGARPFFCLSYMPALFTHSGSLTDIPKNWESWRYLVRTFIEHYSGRNNQNLSDVYYEVWNEPDLPQFGAWKLSSEKDYRILYFHSAEAANSVKDTNRFFIGGPSAGSYYPEWVNKFLDYVSQNKLRLDFYSWHRYHKNPEMYAADARAIRNQMNKYTQYRNIPLLLTEWGVESGNLSVNDSNTAAAHTVASAISFQDYISRAFSFEIKDGPPPNGGRWGLFSHEHSLTPLKTKPKFYAFEALNRLSGAKISIGGQGSFVKAAAADKNGKITVIVVNYDIASTHSENVPVRFTSVPPAAYELIYTYALTGESGTYDIVSTDGLIGKSFLMPPNSILILELENTGTLSTYIKGARGVSGDSAISLNSDNPLTLIFPELKIFPNSSISFDIRPLWQGQQQSYLLFDIPFTTDNSHINRIAFYRQKLSGSDNLVFEAAVNGNPYRIVSPIDTWSDSSYWHHITIGWNNKEIFMDVDGKITSLPESLDIRNGKIMKFYKTPVFLDNLTLRNGDQPFLVKSFDE